MTWEVKDLTYADMPVFAELAEHMHRESGFQSYRLDLERTIYVTLAIGKDERGYARGLWNSGSLVGAMVGEVQQHPFVDLLQAVDHAFYIEQDYRGGLGARTLIKDFEAWARWAGARRLQLAAAAGIDNERASRLLDALGFPRYGAVHVKEM